MYKSLVFILTLSSISTLACDDWFKNLKINSPETCESQCRTSPTDMSSYMCPQECDQLCKNLVSREEETNFYGLTDDEVAFCKKNKTDCLKAYRLSLQAEDSCLSIYKKSDTNDESDACRHYLWAFLMAKEIGVNNAKLVLDGHENNPKINIKEKEMDLINNKIALEDFKNIKNSKKSDDEILILFKNNLKNKKFKVIKPKYSNSGGLP